MKKNITILMSLFLLIILSNVNIVRSEPTPNPSADDYVLTIATKDTYVDSGEPLANYGGQEWLHCGLSWFNDLYIAYFYFPFTDKPNDYDHAILIFRFWGVSQTLDINITLINEEWDEYSMNWENQPLGTGVPSSPESIWEGQITGDDHWGFDVTDYIKGDGISVAIYSTNYIQNDYFLIDSREEDLGYSWYGENSPTLVWVSEGAEIPTEIPISDKDDDDNDDKDDDKPNTRLIDFIYSILVISTIISVISVIIYLPIRRIKQKQKQKQSDILDIKYCNSCGKKINREANFCTYCRAQQL